MTHPFDIPLSFDALEGFQPVIRPLADGVRASTAAECASCAIIEYLAPNDERIYSGFNPGVAAMGHLLHQWWAHQVFGEVACTVEAPIPWEHGVSHDDVLVGTGPWRGAYEVKTHSDPKPKAPSAANMRQAEFRARLRERVWGDGVPYRVVMIGKAGNESGWVRGPWEVTLTDERRNEIDATLQSIALLLARATDLDLHADAELKCLANGCTRCFPKPLVAPKPTVDGLVARYLNFKQEYDELDAQRKAFLDEAKRAKAEMEKAKERLDPLVPEDAIVDCMRGTVTRTRSGALTIRGNA